MLVIGLTGGIGSGKSTVAHLFQEKGITVIDTDQLSRDLTQPEQPALKKIIAHFGESILLPDQTLNRAALRKIIFSNPVEKKWLEDVLHPLIREKTNTLIKETSSPYCIVAIPLLFETKRNPLIQRILVVDANEKTQIDRTAARDHMTESEIKTMMKTQMAREARLAKADDIIDNNGTLSALSMQVEKWHQHYLRMV